MMDRQFLCLRVEGHATSVNSYWRLRHYFRCMSKGHVREKYSAFVILCTNCITRKFLWHILWVCSFHWSYLSVPYTVIQTHGCIIITGLPGPYTIFSLLPVATLTQPIAFLLEAYFWSEHGSSWGHYHENKCPTWKERLRSYTSHTSNFIVQHNWTWFNG